MITKSIPSFRATYEHLSNNQNLSDITEILAARIYHIRDQSSKLIFVDIIGGDVNYNI